MVRIVCSVLRAVYSDVVSFRCHPERLVRRSLGEGGSEGSGWRIDGFLQDVINAPDPLFFRFSDNYPVNSLNKRAPSDIMK